MLPSASWNCQRSLVLPSSFNAGKRCDDLFAGILAEFVALQALHGETGASFFGLPRLSRTASSRSCLPVSSSVSSGSSRRRGHKKGEVGNTVVQDELAQGDTALGQLLHGVPSELRALFVAHDDHGPRPGPVLRDKRVERARQAEKPRSQRGGIEDDRRMAGAYRSVPLTLP